mmetsp:Transcript_3592/g.9327  ORF Transcript_3592/g.9327 Transcript_3592/m.9327 type:complete len:248 (-) Transcript_3592:275-1018(-)|eukprot:CAMPEP_0174896330 /NCGR_PEP_ID=MMETSP0167-20121228/10524_1 /TAXON_ID=38298 /ORGANISM="Rhodella maculata, Strain CCMP736" /LENGTH=247 /DNA_ID=CAMNT_0016135855 /DNA_START=88 /DNA_END=831 /DNA_ORIENTATION=-
MTPRLAFFASSPLRPLPARSAVAPRASSAPTSTPSTAGSSPSRRALLRLTFFGAFAPLLASPAAPAKAETVLGFAFPSFKMSTNAAGLPKLGAESLMSKKAHGTCEKPVQDNLRWSVDQAVADRICCFNRHYAEHSGYYTLQAAYLADAKKATEENPITYYDSVTGKPLFVAPRGRSTEDYLKESAAHGWPSFRDEEVVWENMRCLQNGESVSVDGTHLGHNLPDRKGNRYCINLVSVAGRPLDGKM